MPRPSQINKILEAALHCFAEMGYEGTRVRHIAERAGVAESALYRHYPSKEVIAQTLFQLHCETLKAELQAVVEMDLPVKARLVTVVRMAFADCTHKPDALSYVMTQSHKFKLPEDFVSPLEIVAGVIAEGQAAGLIRSGPPLLLAAGFVGTFIHLLTFAFIPFFDSIDAGLIQANEQLIIDMAWSAIANHD